MKAKIVAQNNNGKNYNGEKELITQYHVLVLDKGQIKEIADCRTYMGRSRNASVVYASLWVYNHTAGSGKAGGWGYHKQSAAIGDAFESAGIELSEDISGRGNTAIIEALEALGKALGYRGQVKVVY